MPNEKILSEKKAIVLELTEKLKSVSGVFIDYSGTTVADDTAMLAHDGAYFIAALPPQTSASRRSTST